MSSSELESRSTAISMQKSVENLVISSQDAIGQSISQALTFSGVLTKHASQAMQEYKSVSRSPSPSLRQADVINDLEYDKPNEISACKPAADNISVSSASDVASPSPAPLRDSKSSSGQRGSDAQTRTKKKSWYNSLYPTYKSKSEDFKRIFKDLPVDERLIVDYSCALQKDILAQGRLYASQNYMCFYANILGWETNVTVRWKDVTAITKEKTALVIPNAILVCTDSEKHFLASITGRDKAYLMLFRIWQNALMDQPVSSQEIWHWVHTCYGEELGFNSDDEDNRQYCRDFADDAAHALEAADEAELAESSLELAYSESKRTRSTSRGRDASPARGSAGDGCAREGDVLPTDMSGSSDSEPDKPPGGDVEKCSSAHEGRLLLQQEFPFNIDQLFTMIFTNSKFNLELLAARKASDYVQANWQSSGGRQVRRVSYTAALAAGPLGPKEVHVTETQIMNKCSKPGVQYSIDASSENAGIPYADYFSVEVHYCMQRVTEHSTSLSMFGYIRYKKSMWPVVKAFLEKNAISGVEEFCRLLEERLRGESEGQAQTGRKVHRQRRHNVAPQLARSAPPGLAPPAPRARPPLLLALLAGALLLANAALYWRLWRTEPPHTELYERMKLVSASQQAEWARLAAAGAARQRDQRRAWDRAVQAALLQLRQTEETLAKLLEAIKPSLDPGPKREPPPPRPSPAQPVRTDL